MAFCVGMAPDVERSLKFIFWSGNWFGFNGFKSNSTAFKNRIAWEILSLANLSWIQPISTHFMYRKFVIYAHVLRIITRMSMAQRCASENVTMAENCVSFFWSQENQWNDICCHKKKQAPHSYISTSNVSKFVSLKMSRESFFPHLGMRVTCLKFVIFP